MKKSFFITALLVLSIYLGAQPNKKLERKKAKYGFGLGFDFSNVVSGDILEGYEVENDLGFRLGILAEYMQGNVLSINPKAELSFSGATLLLPESEKEEINIHPVRLHLITHFVFKKNKKSSRKPYFFIGPNVMIPLIEDVEKNNVFSHSTNFAIDAGIGLDKKHPRFIFSPQLRYSYGLNNISFNSDFNDIYFHNISLVFNFKG